MTNHRHLIHRVQIEVLSPLHIGTGRILRRGFEFDARNGQTWVIDNDALANEVLEQGEESQGWRSLLAGRPAAELLNDSDYRPDSALMRYVLRGVPKAQSTGSEIREMIKDPWDRPYIPGSSLKGALRTAFMVHAFEALEMQFEPGELDKSPKLAARNIEREIVAPGVDQKRAPNHDIFKALQVADSNPDDQRRMVLITGAVYAGKETNIPVALECMPRGATVTTTLTLDCALLERYGPERLGWDSEKQVKWIKDVRLKANNHAFRRIQAERKFWSERGVQSMVDFYQMRYLEMKKLQAEKDNRTFYLQLGWGTGWSSKTLGHLLTRDSKRFYRTVQRYGSNMDLRGNYGEGGAFPRSRKVVVEDERMVAAFGWVRVTMEQTK